MRTVLSISLPAREVTRVRSLAKKRGYQTTSSYIQHLLKADQEIISEAQLLKDIRQAHKEYRAGKSIKVKSLMDLV